MANKINLSIPKELKEKLERELKETNFNSIEEYILYILEQMVSDDKIGISSRKKQAYTDEEEKDIRGPNTYSEEEEEALKKNLKELGYL